MSTIDHEAFVPYHFGTEWLRYEQQGESGLLPVTPSNPINLSDTKRDLGNRKLTRLTYNAANFQYLSWITRLFNPAFVNHSKAGDISGVSAIIGALPYLIFTLPDLQIRLQFVAGEGYEIHRRDKSVDNALPHFMDTAPGSIKITWTETRIWRLDAEGKIVERWHETAPVARLQQSSVLTLNPSR